MSLKKTDSAGSERPISQESLNLLFIFIIDKRMTDAERVLQEIETKENIKGEFNIGFIQALKGIILMYKSSDHNTFLNNLNLNDVNILEKYYSEFLENSKDELHSDYDRGYFSALSEYILFLLKRTRAKKE